MALVLIAKKSGKQVDLSKVAKGGKYTELAVPGEEYYLIDTATGKTPEDVEVSRQDDDLIIRSKKEDMEVVIDQFWQECSPTDQCYAIFDVPATETAEAGQVVVTQVGPDVSAFKAGMVGTLAAGAAFNPMLLGLGALGLAGLAAAGGGGGGSDSSNSNRGVTAPSEVVDNTGSSNGDDVALRPAPEVIANIGGSVTVKPADGSDKVTITYTPEGSDIPITFTVSKNPDGTWVKDNNDPHVLVNSETGKVEITADGVKDNSEVKAESAGQEDTAIAGNDIVDTKNPDIDNDGINNADEKLIGTDPKNNDSNGDTTLDGDEDFDGDGIPNKDESDADSFLPTDKDQDGIADILQPPAPNVQLAMNNGTPTGGVTVEPQAGSVADTIEVTFTPEGNGASPITVVATKQPDDSWKLSVEDNALPVENDGTVHVGENGVISVDGNGKITLTPDAVKDNSDVKAVVKNNSGSPSKEVSITTPEHDDIDGDGIADEGDNDMDGDGVSNADEEVIGSNPKNSDSDGNGTPDGEEDYDKDGLTNAQESDPTSGTVTDRDGVAGSDIATPAAPTIRPMLDEQGQQTGGMIVKPNPGADKVIITYTPEVNNASAGENKTITAEKQSDGSWKLIDDDGVTEIQPTSGITVDNDGTVKFSGDSIADKSEISADTTTTVDNQELTSPITTANVPADEAKPTNKPIIQEPNPSPVAYDENASTANVLHKVTATDADGDPITDYKFHIVDGNQNGYFAIDAQGNIRLTETGAQSEANNFESGANEFTVKVVATDAYNNVSDPADIHLKLNDVTELPEAPSIVLLNDNGQSNADKITNDGTLNIQTNVDGAEIQSVKAVKKDGTEVTVLPQNGTYVLPEGEYVSVTVVSTKGGETKEQKLTDVVIDKSAPSAPIVTANPSELSEDNGSVNIQLPANAKAGDKVTVTFTDEQNQPQNVTFTKGDTGWTTDKPNILSNPTDDNITIAKDAVQDGSIVTAVATDPAGNTSSVSDAIAKSDELPTITIPKAEDGYISNTDQINGIQGTTTNAPDGSVIKIFKDGVEMPTTTPILVKDNQFVISPNQIGEGGLYTVQVVTPANYGGGTGETNPFTVDRIAPAMPQVEPDNEGAVAIQLPEDAKPGDTVTVHFTNEQNQNVKAVLTKTDSGWTSNNDSVKPSSDGKTANIAADQLQDNSTVNAYATDVAGNRSDTDAGRVGNNPASLSVPEVLDGKASYADMIDGISGIATNVPTGSTVKLVGNNQEITTTTDADGKFTFTPEQLANISGSGYTIQVSFDGKTLTSNPFEIDHTNTDLTYRLAELNDDQVEVLNGNGEVIASSEPFGSAQDDKYEDKVVEGNNIRIHNPNLDWLMRNPDDNKDDGDFNYDHAEGWVRNWESRGVSENYRYEWNGAAERADVIIAKKVRTDDNSGAGGHFAEPYRQGLIGAEDTGTAYGDITTITRFIMNTGAGKYDDYIESEGIVGNVKITTNEGNDTIVTKYLRGHYETGSPNFNGSEQIDMGAGNDKLLVTGTAEQTGLDWMSYRDSSLSQTNAKIDMGSGDDIVNIANKVIADNETYSGNYFDLGSGNDQMTTGTITDTSDMNWEGSNIINLGVGTGATQDHDTLVVNGSITSEGAYGGRFLLVSDNASDVIITEKLDSRGGMLMGDQDDNITVNGLVNLHTNDSRNGFAWVDDVFSNSASSFPNEKEWYQGTSTQESFYDQGLKDKITNELGNNYETASRIDLGNGTNSFEAKGGMIYANVIGGDNDDKVTVGIDNAYEWSVNYNIDFHDSNIDTGAGNDTVEVVNVGNNVTINTGDGDDKIHTHNIHGTNVMINAGAGDDKIHLADETYGKTENRVDGGTGYDTVLLSNNLDKSHTAVVLSGTEEGYTNLWNVEEIRFNTVDADSGDYVKIKGAWFGSESDHGALKILGDADNTNLGVNQVDLRGSGWEKSNITEQLDAAGRTGKVTYDVYHHAAGDAPMSTVLYIEHNIEVLI